MSSKVGIYAGSFDPVHDGHVAFAHLALQACKLDKVFFLVEPRPRRKQGVKALEHRQKMVQLAVNEEPGLGTIALEQARFSVVETLPLLKARFEGAELHLLMGDDVLGRLNDWPHIEELIQGVSFIIGIRKQTETEVKERIESLQKARALKVQYQMVKAEAPLVSSSKIRLDLKHHHEPDGLAPIVTDYIKEYGLYSASDITESSE